MTPMLMLTTGPPLPQVSEPSVGSARPAHVHAVLELSKGHLDKHSSDAGSWRALREGDSLCFAAVTGTIDLLRERLSATAAGGNRREQAAPDGNLFSSTGGALACVRCATVVRIHKDEDFKGLKVRVALDTAQYQLDLHAGNISCYDSLNVVVRRPRRENSHRALLESARELMLSADQLSGEPTLPDWLHKTLLGQTADAGVSADELRYVNLPLHHYNNILLHYCTPIYRHTLLHMNCPMKRQISELILRSCSDASGQ